MRCLALFVGIALAACTFRPACASIVVGGSLFVASDGDVIATYQGVSPGTVYSNDLYLDSPANALGILFNNKTSTVGDTVNLGTFTAGRELIFRLHVNDTGDDFFTGPGSRNPDGLPHARVNDMFSPTETLVEFEDLFGTPEGDEGFNDLFFSFTNLTLEPAPVPEPSMMAVFGVLAVIGGFWYRKSSRGIQQ